MAHQVRLLNSIILIALLLINCNTKQEQVERVVQINNTNFKLENGILYYNNQLFTGKAFSFFPDTNDTLQITSYRDGKEHGIWKKFYPGGRVREIRQFDNGNKTGEYIAFWENGNKQLQYFFLNDEYNGTCREWNKEGRLIREMNYENGHEAGPQKMFYDNGQVRANYVISNGRRYGLLGTKNCVNVSDSIFKN